MEVSRKYPQTADLASLSSIRQGQTFVSNDTLYMRLDDDTSYAAVRIHDGSVMCFHKSMQVQRAISDTTWSLI